MTLGEWLDIWVENYLGACKPRTKQIYESDIRVHIKPALGAVRMENLLPHTVQTFYNALASDKADKARPVGEDHQEYPRRTASSAEASCAQRLYPNQPFRCLYLTAGTKSRDQTFGRGRCSGFYPGHSRTSL